MRPRTKARPAASARQQFGCATSPGGFKGGGASIGVRVQSADRRRAVESVHPDADARARDLHRPARSDGGDRRRAIPLPLAGEDRTLVAFHEFRFDSLVATDRGPSGAKGRVSRRKRRMRTLPYSSGGKPSEPIQRTQSERITTRVRGRSDARWRSEIAQSAATPAT